MMQLLSTETHCSKNYDIYPQFCVSTAWETYQKLPREWRDPSIDVIGFKEFAKLIADESSVVLKSEENIKLLEEFYEICNVEETRKFLTINENLIQPLIDIYREAKEIFWENVKNFCIEYDRDPEEDHENLSVIIKTELSPEEALDLLDKFDQKYWLKVDNELIKKIIVMARPA